MLLVRLTFHAKFAERLIVLDVFVLVSGSVTTLEHNVDLYDHGRRTESVQQPYEPCGIITVVWLLSVLPFSVIIVIIYCTGRCNTEIAPLVHLLTLSRSTAHG